MRHSCVVGWFVGKGRGAGSGCWGLHFWEKYLYATAKATCFRGGDGGLPQWWDHISEADCFLHVPVRTDGMWDWTITTAIKFHCRYMWNDGGEIPTLYVKCCALTYDHLEPRSV